MTPPLRHWARRLVDVVIVGLGRDRGTKRPGALIA